jgi:hypothetical protein
MRCLAPLPKEERSPQLEVLLTEEPYVVPAKGQKPPKGRSGLRIQDTSDARSEYTHVSTTQEEGEEEEDAEEEVPSLKRKRATSKDIEGKEHPRGRRKLRKASVTPVGQRATPAQVTVSDSSEDVLEQPRRTKPTPRRYS